MPDGCRSIYALGFSVHDPEGAELIASVSQSNSTHPLLAKFPQLTVSSPNKVIKGFMHTPNLNPSAIPVTQKLRRIPLALQEEVITELNRMIADGVLEKIDSSPYVSNIVVVRKPNGKVRICCDLSDANKAVIPDKYPLPVIEELSKFFSGSTVFSKIDLKWGYLQVRLNPQYRYITAMITPIGLLQWKRLPFGLSSAPSCFQKAIAEILDGCEGTKNFLDDIIIAAPDRATHDRRLYKVLQRLSEYNATINSEKSVFGVPSVDFDGHTVSRLGVRPLQSNIHAFTSIPEPTNSRELHSFLSAANYYRKFVPHMAQISDPLTQLLKKDAVWNWSPQCKSAFERLKQEISSDRVLAHFNSNAKTIVSTDASGVALGAVLSQIQNGDERPIAFASRALSPAERGYSASEREALACIWACEHWHYYLYGRPFTLKTDHSALTTLLSGSNKGRKPMRLLRWSDRLHQYNFDVVYRPGSENSVPDLLSRAPVNSNSPISTTEDSEETQIISTIFGSPTLKALTPAQIAEATDSDPTLKSVIQFLSSGWPSHKPESELKPYHQIHEELSVSKGCLYREYRAVIPESLREQVIQLAHEGHQGIVKLKQRLRTSVWWPNIDSDAERFVRSCESCILAGKGKKPVVPPLNPIQFPSKPWQKLSLDIIGELHSAPQNFRFCLVLTDLHSKWPEVKPVSQITSTAVITFLSELFARWGIPEEIITDNGRQFVSQEFEKFLSGLSIKHCRTALYHPQSNGAVERFNRVLKEGFRCAKVSGQPLESALRSILANYRSTPHSTTGVSPAQLMIGRPLRTPLDLLLLNPSPRKVSFREPLEDRVYLKQQQSKNYTDSNRHTKPSYFPPGSQVRVKNKSGMTNSNLSTVTLRQS